MKRLVFLALTALSLFVLSGCNLEFWGKSQIYLSVTEFDSDLLVTLASDNRIVDEFVVPSQSELEEKSYVLRTNSTVRVSAALVADPESKTGIEFKPVYGMSGFYVLGILVADGDIVIQCAGPDIEGCAETPIP